MTENIIAILPELWIAIGQTLLMLSIGVGCAIVLGGPLGVLLFQMGPRQALENRSAYLVVSWIVNTVRSFPFIILLVVLTPVTAAIVGTSIGPLAASVPLSVAAIPYFARLVEESLREVPRGVIEAAEAMGASRYQIVRRVLLREARSGLVLALTVLAVSFLSYSAVAGVVGKIAGGRKSCAPAQISEGAAPASLEGVTVPEPVERPARTVSYVDYDAEGRIERISWPKELGPQPATADVQAKVQMVRQRLADAAKQS